MVREPRALRFSIASDLTHVHPAVRRADAFVQECGVNDRSKVAILLRELLCHAICLGNKCEFDRSVRCHIEHAGGTQFKLSVENEGNSASIARSASRNQGACPGFKQCGCPSACTRCRGTELVNRGNRVTVVVDAAEQT